MNVPVTVGNTAPAVRLTLPPDGGFYDWGDQVRYTVEVSDPEDGAIDCSKVQVQYLLGHDAHAHPLQQYTGCSGTVQTTLREIGGKTTTINRALKSVGDPAIPITQPLVFDEFAVTVPRLAAADEDS